MSSDDYWDDWDIVLQQRDEAVKQMENSLARAAQSEFERRQAERRSAPVVAMHGYERILETASFTLRKYGYCRTHAKRYFPEGTVNSCLNCSISVEVDDWDVHMNLRTVQKIATDTLATIQLESIERALKEAKKT